MARLIHQHSNRSGRFVAINCAAIVDTLLESELFGHEKGAFTGADRSKPGRFELAADGTLFLDEIAELAPPLQAKLLRALQERVDRTRRRHRRASPISARIIAATHRDLFALAHEGRVSRRPGLPPERHRYRSATAARTARRHPAAGHRAAGKAARQNEQRRARARAPAVRCTAAATTGRAMCANWKTSSPRRWCWRGTARSRTSHIRFRHAPAAEPAATRPQADRGHPACSHWTRSRPHISSACSTHRRAQGPQLRDPRHLAPGAGPQDPEVRPHPARSRLTADLRCEPRVNGPRFVTSTSAYNVSLQRFVKSTVVATSYNSLV